MNNTYRVPWFVNVGKSRGATRRWVGIGFATNFLTGGMSSGLPLEGDLITTTIVGVIPAACNYLIINKAYNVKPTIKGTAKRFTGYYTGVLIGNAKTTVETVVDNWPTIQDSLEQIVR